MADFTWTDEQRAKLVPGATVEFHWDDVGKIRETIVSVRNADVVVIVDADGSIPAVLDIADPDSVVAP